MKKITYITIAACKAVIERNGHTLYDLYGYYQDGARRVYSHAYLWILSATPPPHTSQKMEKSHWNSLATSQNTAIGEMNKMIKVNHGNDM